MKTLMKCPVKNFLEIQQKLCIRIKGMAQQVLDRNFLQENIKFETLQFWHLDSFVLKSNISVIMKGWVIQTIEIAF